MRKRALSAGQDYPLFADKIMKNEYNPLDTFRHRLLPRNERVVNWCQIARISERLNRFDAVQGPALSCLSESGEACVANVVATQAQLLCLAHQTKQLRHESAHVSRRGYKALGRQNTSDLLA